MTGFLNFIPASFLKYFSFEEVSAVLPVVADDETAYKNVGLAIYYCQINNRAKALEHLRLFTKEDNIQYWVILFMDKGPELTETESSPEFKELLKEVERKFWANHKILKLKLQEQGLL